MNIEITDEMLDMLRERVRDYLTEKRYIHTLSVEKEVISLGKIYLPDKINKLRAAALLHDITKRESHKKQLQFADEFGILLANYDALMPKTFHAKTAAALIERDFSEYADDEVISAVRYHTTGRDKMTVFDSLVYLADYIEPERDFPDCVLLRRYFYDRLAHLCNDADINELLRTTLVLSYDMTIKLLLDENMPVDLDTVSARNYFISLKGRAKSNEK